MTWPQSPLQNSKSGTIARFQNLSLNFPQTGKVLENIHFEIQAGEILVLLGPSGCGKSSLLKILAGLLTPSSGEVSLLMDLRNSLGFVFQEPTLLPWSNLLENIQLPAKIRGQTLNSSDILTTLASVGLKDCENLFPRELSGGMKMRASLARALCTRPKLLLLDEPFSALDETIRQQLAEDLRNLCLEKKTSAVFVTHSLTEALFLGDRILSLSHRPAKIETEFKVPLERKRNLELRESTEFIAALKSFRSLQNESLRNPL